MSNDDVIPADALLALIARLRKRDGAPLPYESTELRQYMAGVAQGKRLAARRLEELLLSYGVTTAQEAPQ